MECQQQQQQQHRPRGQEERGEEERRRRQQQQEHEQYPRVPGSLMPAHPAVLPHQHQLGREHEHERQQLDGRHEGLSYQQLQQQDRQDVRAFPSQHATMAAAAAGATMSMPSGNPASAVIFPAVPSEAFKSSSDADMRSLTTAADDVSVASTDDLQPSQHTPRRAGSVLSMDDPDVRIAAQALGDLRADFVSSPPAQHSSLTKDPTRPFSSSSPPDTTMMNGGATERRGSQQQPQPLQPEPLLSLLTTTHPLLSTAISGSLSAYSTSKLYSPRFKSGAEFVERHIGTPVASTVNTVGRRTGVEGGVRWWLGSRRSSAVANGDEDEDEAEGAHKRRKISNATTYTQHSIDLERGVYANMHEYAQSRRQSQLSFESLPAYDDNRSPSYEAQAQAQAQNGALVTTTDEATRQAASSWQSRLMLSTSGLGVAMSEESLRSLKYCLTWLRWANVHLGKIIVALRNVMEEWDRAHRSPTSSSSPPHIQSAAAAAATADTKSPTASSPSSDAASDSPTSKTLTTLPTPEDEAALTARIQALKSDVLQTLKKVVDIVSKYTGGALPENARLLVRRHLTSLPQRFQLASSSKSTAESAASLKARGRDCPEAVGSATRVMVLASEGLDMMAQVSGVLDGTIASAEEWCERLGRRKRGEPEEDGEMGDDEATPVDAETRGLPPKFDADVKYGAKATEDGREATPQRSQEDARASVSVNGWDASGKDVDAKTPVAEVKLNGGSETLAESKATLEEETDRDRDRNGVTPVPGPAQQKAERMEVDPQTA